MTAEFWFIYFLTIVSGPCVPFIHKNHIDAPELTFEINSRQFNVHKFIIESTSSEYLKSLIVKNGDDQQPIAINDIDPDMFSFVLDVFYGRVDGSWADDVSYDFLFQIMRMMHQLNITNFNNDVIIRNITSFPSQDLKAFIQTIEYIFNDIDDYISVIAHHVRQYESTLWMDDDLLERLIIAGMDRMPTYDLSLVINDLIARNASKLYLQQYLDQSDLIDIIDLTDPSLDINKWLLSLTSGELSRDEINELHNTFGRHSMMTYHNRRTKIGITNITRLYYIDDKIDTHQRFGICLMTYQNVRIYIEASKSELDKIIEGHNIGIINKYLIWYDEDFRAMRLHILSDIQIIEQIPYNRYVSTSDLVTIDNLSDILEEEVQMQFIAKYTSIQTINHRRDRVTKFGISGKNTTDIILTDIPCERYIMDEYPIMDGDIFQVTGQLQNGTFHVVKYDMISGSRDNNLLKYDINKFEEYERLTRANIQIDFVYKYNLKLFIEYQKRNRSNYKFVAKIEFIDRKNGYTYLTGINCGTRIRYPYLPDDNNIIDNIGTMACSKYIPSLIEIL